MHIAAPGSYCFAITRTRHFDEILLSEIRSGIEQVVLLGAGYDSRAFRFQDELEGVSVYEIDHPGTQARKKRILEKVCKQAPRTCSYLSVDFNRQSLQTALADRGFSREKKTLFLWEGVSYYLPQPVVEGVLDSSAAARRELHRFRLRHQELRRRRHQHLRRQACRALTTGASSTASSGSCDQVRLGVICRELGPHTTCYNRFVRWRRLVSGTRSWTPWPPLMMQRCR